MSVQTKTSELNDLWPIYLTCWFLLTATAVVFECHGRKSKFTDTLGTKVVGATSSEASLFLQYCKGQRSPPANEPCRW